MDQGVSYLVGALIRVNHKGLHEGWTRTSLDLQMIHFTSRHTTSYVFWAYLYSASTQHGNQHPAGWPILFCGPTQEPALATANAGKNRERFWKQQIFCCNVQQVNITTGYFLSAFCHKSVTVHYKNCVLVRFRLHSLQAVSSGEGGGGLMGFGFYASIISVLWTDQVLLCFGMQLSLYCAHTQKRSVLCFNQYR